MPLTNTQYDQIFQKYEENQRQSRRERERRLAYVYEHIPKYRALEEETASQSVIYGKKLLLEEETSLKSLQNTLVSLKEQKKQLLLESGLPENYLEPIYVCPSCHDTGYIDNVKCHCFRQAEIALLYEQSGIQEMLKSNNFSLLSYEYYQGEALALFQHAVKTCHNFICAERHKMHCRDTSYSATSYYTIFLEEGIIQTLNKNNF